VSASVGNRCCRRTLGYSTPRHQSERLIPQVRFIKRWVPELSKFERQTDSSNRVNFVDVQKLGVSITIVDHARFSESNQTTI